MNGETGGNPFTILQEKVMDDKNEQIQTFYIETAALNLTRSQKLQALN